MRSTLKTSCSGYSILEQAIILPVVLLVLLGAFDVNNVFQTKAALKAAAKVSLRECYPTDSSCAGGIREFSSDPYYNWYTRLPAPPSFTSDKVAYKASASILKLPTYQYTDFWRTEVTKHNFDVVKKDYKITAAAKYPSTNYKYIYRTKDLPYVTGTASERIFKFYNSKGGEETTGSDGSVTGNVSTLSASSSPWKEVASFKLSRPALFAKNPSTGCFGKNPDNASASSNCDRGWPALTISDPAYDGLGSGILTLSSSPATFGHPNYTYAIFYLRGQQSHTEPAKSTAVQCAKAHLTISGSSSAPSPSSDGNLGGQVFNSENDEASFFPRGVPNTGEHLESGLICKMSGNKVIAGYKEFCSHQGLKLEYGKEYHLWVKLERTYGTGCSDANAVKNHTISWKSNSLKLFQSDYELVQGSKSCTTLAPMSADKTNYPWCFTFKPELEDPSKPTTWTTVSDEKTYEGAYSLSEATSRLNAQREKDLTAFYSAPQVTKTTNEAYTVACNPNCGTWQGSGLTTDGEAAKLCSDSIPSQLSGAEITNNTWTIEEKRENTSPLTWTKDNCSVSIPTLKERSPAMNCIDQMRYTVSRAGDTIIGTGRETLNDPSLDPAYPPNYRKAHNLECSEIGQETVELTSSTLSSLNGYSDSMFIPGQENRDACNSEDEQKQLRNMLRQSIETLISSNPGWTKFRNPPGLSFFNTVFLNFDPRENYGVTRIPAES